MAQTAVNKGSVKLPFNYFPHFHIVTVTNIRWEKAQRCRRIYTIKYRKKYVDHIFLQKLLQMPYVMTNPDQSHSIDLFEKNGLTSKTFNIFMISGFSLQNG